jgi:hypothetical protein
MIVRYRLLRLLALCVGLVGAARVALRLPPPGPPATHAPVSTILKYYHILVAKVDHKIRLRMKGFISYSHDDFEMFEEFRTHLRSVERALDINFWCDPRISAGTHWTTEIGKAIKLADVFILLASPAFIESDYIYDEEIPRIKEKNRKFGALVLPVVLMPCAWQLVADSLQAVPIQNGRLKPITDWRRRSDGFDHARSQIGDAIQSYFGLSAKTVGWAKP